MKQSTSSPKPTKTAKPPRRRGPPNRMNDLAYKDWMKFQKSFFRHESSQALVEKCIFFFTKAVWPNRQPSQSLIIGVDSFNAGAIPVPRIIDTYSTKSLADIDSALAQALQTDKEYDFILVDLRRHIIDESSLATFLRRHSDDMFQALRWLMVPQRYCGVLIGMGEKGGRGFPYPWAVAMSSRQHLKLRDEKIGLVESQGTLLYCLFMQAEDDERLAFPLMPKSLRLARTDQDIPGWIIPKPPPRKPNEILHPAKYPETLVAEFTNLFTQPGDKVFDPMVGTGSTIIAALRTGRDGYGVEINPEYVTITQNRIRVESKSAPFNQALPQSEALVMQGDALRLNEINQLDGLKFDYAITSPPYWSMLSNPGGEGQRARRKKNLPLVYSHDNKDLGNVQDYDRFLELLESAYNQVAVKLADNAYLTVVVKNIKRNHVQYTLAWDLVARLCGSDGKYDYLGTTLWCQDNVGLKPFAVGILWVSNTLHHYCLHFRPGRER